MPIRACATPDKVQFAQFALSGAEFFLHYYDTYFGIKYPMPKLDMIAIPDFEAGAMENFGAITYRETAMLVDEKNASVDAKKVVAVDVAHEMAHQWFGDMVTMEWWDNIWLNEGFATWMSNKPLAAWKPEWDIPQDEASDLNKTLDLDGRRVTRTIRARAETPGEINEMFDGITYGKAAAVLLMTENYLGDEAFRAGVHRYLQAHMYGNATAEDFWNTLQQSSGKPVDKIMESLVTQPGEPLLTFGVVRDGSVKVTQKRFFLNPREKEDEQQSWTLPVCMKSSGDPLWLPHPQCRRATHAGAASGRFLRQRRRQGLLPQPLRQRRLSTTAAPGGERPYALRADHVLGQPMGAGPRRHRHRRRLSQSCRCSA